MNSESEDLRRRIKDLSDSNRKLSDYESKLQLAGQEIDRLNQVLKSKSDEANTLDSKLRNSKSELDMLRKKAQEMESGIMIELQSKLSLYEQKNNSLNQENEEMRSRINQLLDGNRRLADYESKLQIASQ